MAGSGEGAAGSGGKDDTWRVVHALSLLYDQLSSSEKSCWSDLASTLNAQAEAVEAVESVEPVKAMEAEEPVKLVESAVLLLPQASPPPPPHRASASSPE